MYIAPLQRSAELKHAEIEVESVRKVARTDIYIYV